MAKYLDFTGLEYFAGKIQTALNGKATSSHTHAAGDITSGTLPVARGGTGNTSVDTTPTSGSTKMVTSGGVYTALSGKAASSHNHAASDITSGTLGVARGGTGVTSNPSMLTNLGSTTAASVFAASPRPGVTGTLPVANGGTGATTAAAALTALGAAASSHTHSEYMTAADPEGTGTLSMNRKADTTYGAYSTTLGRNCTASGNMSFAFGVNGEASGANSFAGGSTAKATNARAFAFGVSAEASGQDSIAIGSMANASALCAVAIGSGGSAQGDGGVALGSHPIALAYQTATGHYNSTTNATAGVETGTGTGTAFVIGNGTNNTSASNAFRVDYNGKPYAKSSFTTTGCDYAEYFEWLDGNAEAEDRRGYFVTLDGDKIKKAEPGDYILGIISGQPSVIGNGDEDWMGRYIMDDFGAFVYETFEYEEDIIDDETGEVTGTVKKTGTKYKENPDYDPSKGYIQREDRPEWSAVGMLGVLTVWDDGTCEVNGYCKVAEGGTATKAETGYRVIKRVNDNLVKVIFR